MKKFIAVLMAAMLLILTFAGCADTKAPEEEKTTDEPASSVAAASQTSDLAYVKNKGTLVVGITDYAPMDYHENGSDEWTGFDAELARAFAQELGVEVEFLELADWDSKFFELNAKEIDCIWNGMTITDEVLLNTDCSNAYVQNEQVVVMAKDKLAEYPDAESLKGLTFAVEAGSAGESAALDNGFSVTAVQTQTSALMEVAAGTADACIIDSTMADAMTGEGTSYEKYGAGLILTSEEYGVGFRKGSDITAVFNSFLTEYDGLEALAEKYELVLAK